MFQHQRYLSMMPKAKPFVGKIVLITGGSSGIGLATAIAFAAAGAKRVVVCSRQISKWQTIAQPQIAKSLPAEQASVIEWQEADVRVLDQMRQLVQSIVQRYGKLDVAFNNAGVAAGAPIAQQTLISSTNAATQTPASLTFELAGPQPWSGTLRTCPDVSLQAATSPFCENALFTDGMGVWNSMKAELEVMVKQLPSVDPPVIVNTASINSNWGSPGAAFYSAAKAMVNLLTKSVAVEQASSPSTTANNSSGSSPIRVNCVMPGAVYTPLLANQIGPNATYAAVSKVAAAGVPMGRIATPEEIAPAVLFLANNQQSSYITGTSLVIDGGLTASPLLST